MLVCNKPKKLLTSLYSVKLMATLFNLMFVTSLYSFQVKKSPQHINPIHIHPYRFIFMNKQKHNTRSILFTQSLSLISPKVQEVAHNTYDSINKKNATTILWTTQNFFSSFKKINLYLIQNNYICPLNYNYGSRRNFFSSSSTLHFII